MSGGFWYCHKTSLPPSFRHSSLSIAVLALLPVPSWWPEHEGAICHSVLIPARVLRARHSPLTRLGCHVRWLTGKVTSGDKRPQLESVSNPPLFPLPPFPYMHTQTDTQRPIWMYTPVCAWKICLLYLYSTDSLQRAHVQLIFSILQLHDILTGERVSRRIEEREDGERHAESGIPPSDHYERHVKRGRETEALTWASPHRERLRGGREGRGTREAGE